MRATGLTARAAAMAWRDLDHREPAPFEPEPPEGGGAALCVLASGSSGNCTLLRVWDGAGKPVRTSLIDAGLSPRRTQAMLLERGIALRDLDDIILTHLDTDHFHAGWRRHRDCHATLRLHARHVSRAQRRHSLLRRNEPFNGRVELAGGVAFDPVMLSHDELGVAAFRFDFPCGGSLGFATDLGRATDELIEHVRGVGVLAIESNYCPVMQAESARPEFLKRRITGGAGHLSNEECARAVGKIGPAGEVVLLHLSRQCNTPGLASAPHAGGGYRLTLASQHEATGWIRVVPGTASEERIPASLFHAAEVDDNRAVQNGFGAG